MNTCEGGSDSEAETRGQKDGGTSSRSVSKTKPYNNAKQKKTAKKHTHTHTQFMLVCAPPTLPQPQGNSVVTVAAMQSADNAANSYPS